jgi:peptidoglycan hydrolase CwlO-like protein
MMKRQDTLRQKELPELDKKISLLTQTVQNVDKNVSEIKGDIKKLFELWDLKR